MTARLRRYAVCLALAIPFAAHVVLAAPEQEPGTKATLARFQEQVNDYLALRWRATRDLPPLPSAAKLPEIVATIELQVRAIRRVCDGARSGEIFDNDVAVLLRQNLSATIDEHNLDVARADSNTPPATRRRSWGVRDRAIGCRGCVPLGCRKFRLTALPPLPDQLAVPVPAAGPRAAGHRPRAVRRRAAGRPAEAAFDSLTHREVRAQDGRRDAILAAAVSTSSTAATARNHARLATNSDVPGQTRNRAGIRGTSQRARRDDAERQDSQNAAPAVHQAPCQRAAPDAACGQGDPFGLEVRLTARSDVIESGECEHDGDDRQEAVPQSTALARFKSTHSASSGLPRV